MNQFKRAEGVENLCRITGISALLDRMKTLRQNYSDNNLKNNATTKNDKVEYTRVIVFLKSFLFLIKDMDFRQLPYKV